MPFVVEFTHNICWFAQLYTNIGVIIRADKLGWDDINDALLNC